MSPRRWIRSWSRLWSLAAAIGALALVAAAPAGAAGGPVAVFWTFHRVYNISSRLTGTAQDTGDGSIITQRGWRAGSGQTQDECDSPAYDYVGGWLPGGWYALLAHYHHFQGSLVQGRLWRLEDKRCAGGTGALRTELFINSEETWDNRQACSNPYVDRFCWDGDRDFYSNGAIKLARAAPYPSDLAQADNLWDGYDGHYGQFWLGRRLYVY